MFPALLHPALLLTADQPPVQYSYIDGYQEDTMSRRYSIAEARHNLAAIVHELEHQPVIELTRRGEAVAVLLSLDSYRKLLPGNGGFWAAYSTFRDTFELEQLELEADNLSAGRDRSPGREVVL